MMNFLFKNSKKYERTVLGSRSSPSIIVLFRKCSTKIVLEPGYQPKNVESRQMLKVSQVVATNDSNKTFSMILPPPNVTGYIHLGHCLTATVQDVVARAKRKEGFCVEWIPGMDHAGIATQMVVEKTLKKERNLTRHDLGRQKFLEEVWKWKQAKSTRTKEDLLQMGTTLDWNKEYFTMDPSHSRAVREAFIRLFEKGLIYRSKSLVNWSCAFESAISDIEVDNLEIVGPTDVSVPGYQKTVKFGQIFDIIYKTTDGEEIIVSTTRPETILGDVAVAVNPTDVRYGKFLQDKNLRLVHPFRNDTIPLVEDESVDPEFGSGAVKITPGHDKNDFLVAQRHNLPLMSIMDEKGVITGDFGPFSGVSRFLAREMILDALAEKCLLKEVKPHKMVLPMCSRSKDIIEFQLRPQWFVRCKEMSEKALAAVDSGQIKIHPENFTRDWENWLGNCRDWCISRQLWWGHRIPAWQGDNRDIWVAAHTKEEALGKLRDSSLEVKQDEDVLDTWFSSALLPFSLHGWPDKPLNHFYPLSLMETGHDILFFWVARMAMLGLELTESVPFKEILLHGIVCDAHGRKMSKSLGNVITPDQIINGISLEKLQKETKSSFNSGILSQKEYEKSIKGQRKMFPQGIPECGTDALRFTLCSHNIKSHFINFDIQEVHTNKLFFNKIWQATRYTIGFCEKLKLDLSALNIEDLRTENLSSMDCWIMSRLSETSKIVREAIESFNFHLATAALKNFFYTNLCDTYLETTKRNQVEGRAQQGENSCRILALCLAHGLDLMEPFTPFLASDLKKVLPKKCQIKSLDLFRNPLLETEVAQILDICVAVRQQKSQHNITKRHKPMLYLHPTSSSAQSLLESYRNDIETLTFSTSLIFVSDPDEFTKKKFMVQSTAGALCSFGVVTEMLEIDKGLEKTKELNRKKLQKLEKELQKITKIVTNQGYKESASADTQTKHSEKMNKLQMEIENIKAIQ